MKDFNWERFKENRIAVHCDTEEKAKDFLQECDKRGIVWADGISPASESNYEKYKNKTCYNYYPSNTIQGLRYDEIDFFKEYDYDIIEWEIEEKTGDRKMKLLELLEAGKKVTHKDMFIDKDAGYLVLENDKIIYYLDGKNLGEIELTFKDFTSADWEEYKEKPKYKTNFDMERNEIYNYICDDGDIIEVAYDNHRLDTELLENFNAFKDEELAKYIQAKQLLERKLMMFSYLNGADKIDWKNTHETKYYIERFCNHYNDKLEIATDYTFDFMDDNRVYFKTKEVAEEALELYKNEIDKAMKMRKEFGF